MPWKIYQDENKYCVHKLNDDDSQGERVACHDTEEKAQQQMKALYASEDGGEMSGFLFVDLQASSLIPGKPFAGFAAGTFVDMFGREVELKAKDIKDFVTNTLALIADFQGRGMPGLPIDEQLHNKGKAAGWIVSAEPGEVQDTKGRTIPVIKVMAEWTKVGVELIRDKIMANFSPTVDLKNKVLRGGSLTNWPATQDERGVPLFAAVELSQGMYIIEPAEPESNRPHQGQGEFSMSDEEKDMAVEMTQPAPDPAPAKPAPKKAAAKPAAPPEQAQDVTAELMGELFKQAPVFAQSRPEHLAELVQNLAIQMAEKQVQTLLEEQQNQWEITELAAKLTGGGMRGLPVTIPELTDFFLSLEPSQFEKAKSIFSKITNNGLVEFQELGHSRLLGRKRQLPIEYHKHLREAIDAGNTVDVFFRELGLGDPAEYDLSQFAGGK